MTHYSYVKPLLLKAGKKALGFINWISDDRKRHKFKTPKNLNGVTIKRNNGGGSEIYVHYELKAKFFEYLKENNESNRGIKKTPISGS